MWWCRYIWNCIQRLYTNTRFGCCCCCCKESKIKLKILTRINSAINLQSLTIVWTKIRRRFVGSRSSTLIDDLEQRQKANKPFKLIDRKRLDIRKKWWTKRNVRKYTTTLTESFNAETHFVWISVIVVRNFDVCAGKWSHSAFRTHTRAAVYINQHQRRPTTVIEEPKLISFYAFIHKSLIFYSFGIAHHLVPHI